MLLHPLLLVLGLSTVVPALAQGAGTFEIVGDTQVSAMMMFLVSSDKVYIVDKVEGNPNQINGHSQYAAVWDIHSKTASALDTQTNAFCAAGMHLPDGSYGLFGGNAAVGPGGDNSDGSNTTFDATYDDWDGRRAIRLFNQCDENTQCGVSDNVTQMAKNRWYPGCEALGDGTVVLIGGYTGGGYINRNYPNTDPTYEGGAAEPTFEFYPPASLPPAILQFLILTSGLNSYPLTYLMPSGKMLLQANYSTALWDYNNNNLTYLPDMPGQIVRVYPASGANAMLPLTPANNYTPTILFCGGTSMADELWGDYSYPYTDTWNIPASKDCQRLTPEPSDGSPVAYVQDDDLPIGRTMGQFIALPDGTFFLVNGAQNGTAGYAKMTKTTPTEAMPFGESLASGPVLQPAIYDPEAPAGSRWSTANLGSSTIPRLYHSSALLLPNGSVMVAGSNPNIDYSPNAHFPTTYTAEYFYPLYLSAKTRPEPQNIPDTLSYGGNYFDITIPPTSYSGSANDAANNTKIRLIRPGFTTHAMNMGQRMLQLNHTYTVNANGTIVLHVSQVPPNPNLIPPGPCMVFVAINRIPSVGKFVIVGNGKTGTQPTSPAAELPANVLSTSASGTAPSSSPDNSNNSGSSSHIGAIIGAVVAGIGAVGVLGAVFGFCLARRRRQAAVADPASIYPISGAGFGGFTGREMRNSDSSAFMPLRLSNQHEDSSMLSPTDQFGPRASSQFTQSGEFNPYGGGYISRSSTPR